MLDYCHIQGLTAIAESNPFLPEVLFKLGQNLARWPFLIAKIMIVAIQANASGPPASKTGT